MGITRETHRRVGCGGVRAGCAVRADGGSGRVFIPSGSARSALATIGTGVAGVANVGIPHARAAGWADVVFVASVVLWICADGTWNSETVLAGTRRTVVTDLLGPINVPGITKSIISCATSYVAIVKVETSVRKTDFCSVSRTDGALVPPRTIMTIVASTRFYCCIRHVTGPFPVSPVPALAGEVAHRYRL